MAFSQFIANDQTNALNYLGIYHTIKLFTAIIYGISKLARVFVLRKAFQPSVMFAGKDGAYLSGAPERLS